MEKEDLVLETFKKCYRNLSPGEYIPSLDKEWVDRVLERCKSYYNPTLLSEEPDKVGYINYMFNCYIKALRYKAIKPLSEWDELFFSDRGFISRYPIIIKKVGMSSLYFHKTNNFKNLISPIGDLANCVKLELLCRKYKKDNIFMLTKEERDEACILMKIGDYNYGSKYLIPKVIYDEFMNSYLNRSFYICYPWPKFNKEWKIREVKLELISSFYTYYFRDQKTNEKIYIGDASCSRDRYIIALDKKMLIEQLESVKETRTSILNKQIIKKETKIKDLEVELEKTRIKLEELIYNYAFEEEKINKLLKDGKIA